MRKPVKAILLADLTYIDHAKVSQLVKKDTLVAISCAAPTAKVEDINGNAISPITRYSVQFSGKWYQIFPHEFAFAC